MAERRSNRFRVRIKPKPVKTEDVFANLSDQDCDFADIVIQKIKLICESTNGASLESIELKTSDFTGDFVPNIQYILGRLCELDFLILNREGNYNLKKDSDLYNFLEEMKLF